MTLVTCRTVDGHLERQEGSFFNKPVNKNDLTMQVNVRCSAYPYLHAHYVHSLQLFTPPSETPAFSLVHLVDVAIHPSHDCPRPVRRVNLILGRASGFGERRRAGWSLVRVHAREDPLAGGLAGCGAEEERGERLVAWGKIILVEGLGGGL